MSDITFMEADGELGEASGWIEQAEDRIKQFYLEHDTEGNLCGTIPENVQRALAHMQAVRAEIKTAREEIKPNVESERIWNDGPDDSRY